VKSDDEGVVKRVARGVEALELLPGVYLSWSPKEKMEKVVESVKRAVVENWEESGEGPTLEVAVLELDERQYKGSAAHGPNDRREDWVGHAGGDGEASPADAVKQDVSRLDGLV